MKRTITLFLGAILLIVLSSCGSSSSSSSSAPTFSITYDPGGAYAVSVVDGLTYATTQAVDVLLKDGVTVSGQVTDSSGSPLDNVDVSLHAAMGSPELDADTTDASGN